MRPTMTYLSTISFYRVIYFIRIQDDRTVKVLTIPRETNPIVRTRCIWYLQQLFAGVKYVFPKWIVGMTFLRPTLLPMKTFRTHFRVRRPRKAILQKPSAFNRNIVVRNFHYSSTTEFFKTFAFDWIRKASFAFQPTFQKHTPKSFQARKLKTIYIVI